MNATKVSINKKTQDYPESARILFSILSQIDKGVVSITTPRGDNYTFGKNHSELSCHINIHDWRFCDALLSKGDIGLGESYIDQYWDCDKLNNLIHIGIHNDQKLKRAIFGSAYSLLKLRVKHMLNRNTISGSKKNILAHYDLGNDFYKLWLDKTMTYSSAYFNDQSESLEAAQIKKYEQIFNRLNYQEGEVILEVGCGWGGFMEYAISRGAKVVGVTISDEQFSWATKRLEKYSDRAQVKLCDYRLIEGQFDHIVSIEMFEALGKEYWHTYFEKLKNLIKPKGRIVIQSITICEKDFSSYTKGTDFIQQYIFPGGFLPSKSKLIEAASLLNFELVEFDDFGLSYAKTLDIWNQEFMDVKHGLDSSKFDKNFKRMWHFYLKYCQGGFEARKISVGHFCFEQGDRK